MNGETDQLWAAKLLAEYPVMMTVKDVADVLNVEPRQLRALVRHPDPHIRITATKINGVWRFPRDELATYLHTHGNLPGADHE